MPLIAAFKGRFWSGFCLVQCRINLSLIHAIWIDKWVAQAMLQVYGLNNNKLISGEVINSEKYLVISSKRGTFPSLLSFAVCRISRVLVFHLLI